MEVDRAELGEFTLYAYCVIPEQAWAHCGHGVVWMSSGRPLWFIVALGAKCLCLGPAERERERVCMHAHARVHA